jgi:hypothetical protein
MTWNLEVEYVHVEALKVMHDGIFKSFWPCRPDGVDYRLRNTCAPGIREP